MEKFIFLLPDFLLESQTEEIENYALSRGITNMPFKQTDLLAQQVESEVGKIIGFSTKSDFEVRFTLFLSKLKEFKPKFKTLIKLLTLDYFFKRASSLESWGNSHAMVRLILVYFTIVEPSVKGLTYLTDSKKVERKYLHFLFVKAYSKVLQFRKVKDEIFSLSYLEIEEKKEREGKQEEKEREGKQEEKEREEKYQAIQVSQPSYRAIRKQLQQTLSKAFKTICANAAKCQFSAFSTVVGDLQNKYNVKWGKHAYSDWYFFK